MLVGGTISDVAMTIPQKCRLGQCIPYIESDQPNLCDEFYTIGVDKVYLPNGRARNSLLRINEISSFLVVEALSVQCRYEE